MPILPPKQYTTIESLIIYHECTLNQLNLILSHTPDLRYLHCFSYY